jgi:5-methylcytosine-specific restriction protein B
LRPVEQNGTLSYEIVSGRFLDFCQRATGRDTSVLIIDEINRADLARVFGELMYLLEYREAQVALAAGGMFSIPRNVLLIGTMNTADRSVALVDNALRRRFAFLPLQPNYELLRRIHADLNIEPLIHTLQQINAQLDPTQQLGVSFFLTEALPQELELIWRTEIEPYLEEQFFDRPTALAPFRWQLLASRLNLRQP